MAIRAITVVNAAGLPVLGVRAVDAGGGGSGGGGSPVLGVATDACPELCGCEPQSCYRALELCGVTGGTTIPAAFVSCSSVCRNDGGRPYNVHEVVRFIGLCWVVRNGPTDTIYVERPVDNPDDPPPLPDGKEYLPLGATVLLADLTCVPGGCADDSCTAPLFYKTTPCGGAPEMPDGWLTPAVSTLKALQWFAAFGQCAFSTGVSVDGIACTRCVDFSEAFPWSSLAGSYDDYTSAIPDRIATTEPTTLWRWYDLYGHSCCFVSSDLCKRIVLGRNGYHAKYPLIGAREVGEMPYDDGALPLIGFSDMDTGEFLGGSSAFKAIVAAQLGDIVPYDGLPLCIGAPVVLGWRMTCHVSGDLEDGTLVEGWWEEEGLIPDKRLVDAFLAGGGTPADNVTGTYREKITPPSGPVSDQTYTIGGMLSYTHGMVTYLHSQGGVHYPKVHLMRFPGGAVHAVDGLSSYATWRNNVWSASLGGSIWRTQWQGDQWVPVNGGGFRKSATAEAESTMTWGGTPPCAEPCPGPVYGARGGGGGSGGGEEGGCGCGGRARSPGEIAMYEAIQKRLGHGGPCVGCGEG